MAHIKFASFEHANNPTVYWEPAVTVAVVLRAIALVIVVALLAAADAGTLARIDGATYPAALTPAPPLLSPPSSRSPLP
ncbi:hypothetical protein OHA74_53285 [Streptomyces phaeochromogenes]|uniref:hypothetical protein n=1 Tax=Streptomyces phaeochromogenes TaxID=1923 RepID=UPI002E2BFFE7|nr:hypothetical protein [Streptomyces phaeochromogenes]